MYTGIQLLLFLIVEIESNDITFWFNQSMNHLALR